MIEIIINFIVLIICPLVEIIYDIYVYNLLLKHQNTTNILDICVEMGKTKNECIMEYISNNDDALII